MLGSSGHLQRPSAGVRASYSACLPPDHATNRHVKVIANLAFTTSAGENPHIFTYVPGKTAVNELHEVEPLPGNRRLDIGHKKSVYVFSNRMGMELCI